MNRKMINKFIALFLALLIIVVLFSMNFFIVSHIHHHCTGTDCPVCSQIHQAEGIINQITVGVILSSVFICFILFFIKIKSMFTWMFISINPIEEKVRMNR